MTISLVLGVNGQDGSYLAEILLSRGHQVVGVGRQPNSRYTQPCPNFRYVPTDIGDETALTRVLEQSRPESIFHFAAIHGSASFNYEARAAEAHRVNLASVLVCLEYLRRSQQTGFITYASSAKVFQAPLAGIITESYPTATSCLYSFAKRAAEDLLDYYAKTYGVARNVLYLFHHESVRRPDTYFMPRVVATLRSALADRSHRAEVDTLDFYCDWGCAREFMDITADLAERRLAGKYILASGKTWHALALVDELFRRHGLDQANHITQRSPARGRDLSHSASADALAQALGRRPVKDALHVAEEMLGQTKKQHAK